MKKIILLLSFVSIFQTSYSQSSYFHHAGNTGVQLTNFSGRQQNQFHEISWQVYNETPADIYVVERRSSLNEPFTEIQRITATRNNASNNYNVKIPSIASGEIFYRVVTARNGGTTYSNIITVGNRTEQEFRAFVSGSTLFVNLPEDARAISFHSTDGKLISQQTVTGGRGMTSFSLSRFSRGLMIVSVVTQRGRLATKIMY